MTARNITTSLQVYLQTGRAMQIATTYEGQPWIATVYFVADESNNLYWLSYPSRRHSEELAQNNHIAIAIVVKADQPVIGVQAEGVAERVSDPEIVKRIMPMYIEKYGQGREFYDRFVAGTAKHALYKFTPTSFVLFDELHFPGDARKEITL